jgi:hypothetical protein
MRRALESILAQTFTSWHLVVVLTPTLGLATTTLTANEEIQAAERSLREAMAPYKESLEGRFTVAYMRDRDNGTMETAANVGIRASPAFKLDGQSKPGTHRQFVTIHDVDDTWEPPFLDETMKTLEKLSPTPDSEVQGAVTRSFLLYEKTTPSNSTDPDVVVPLQPRTVFMKELECITLADLLYSNGFPPISFVFSMSAWKRLGGFDESMPVLGDW